ncbi:MAG TPA: TonB-dependent receptor [Thermoanaerobaculia bacterium]|nr:TonB-dependent receptor [Thermoanaerobaculia bacterium]
MMRHRGTLIFLAGFVLLLTLALAPAGAQSAGGILEGRVLDPDGAALPGATVTATNPATGVARSTTTDAGGSFRFGALPAGSWDVVVELAGFSTVTQQGVVVNVASTRTLEVKLSLASIEEAITVTDEAPLINNSASVGTVISQSELANLPLNGRQFANVAVLAPGTTLGYNTDPTKPGQLVVQLNGGTGRNVNYVIDGGDNTDDTIGGALQNFNLEAVQEFKIQTMQYKAEFGRSSGGVLSVVTKTGTNDFSGSVYGFFRDDSLNAKTTTEKNAGVDKQFYERKQYGASLGGPIVQDKAHFFATAERTERDTNYTVFTEGAFPEFDGQVVATPFEDTLGTAKVSWNIDPRQYLQVRYGYQSNDDTYGSGPRTAPSNLGTIGNDYSSILVSHTAQIGSTALNEAVFQYTKFENAITANSDDPLIAYPSGFSTGQNLNTPQTTNQTKYQYKDDFSWSSNLFGMRNEFKVGGNYIHEPTLGGDFSTGKNGQFTAVEDRIGSPISIIEFYGGFFVIDTPIDQYSVYVQDDLRVSDNLTLNVGLRYDYWDKFDLDQRSNPLYATLHEQRTYDEPYLRDFWDFDGVLDNDDDNFAPRLGFTWDLKGDGRMLLRGGYGTFYDFPYTNATILFPNAAVISSYGLVYRYEDQDGIRNPDGTFWQPGDPLPPSQVPPDLAGPDEIASPTLATPYSDQLSLGFSWEATDWLGLNFEAVSIDYHDIPFRFRPNVTTERGGPRRFGGSNWRMWHGGGRGSYDGVNIGARIRSEKWELQGFYTWSEAESNIIGGVDEFRLTGGDFQADTGGTRARRDQSVNPLDPWCGACFGPVYRDAKNRITIGGTYELPWALRLSGMLRYHSGFPYSAYARDPATGASLDLNGDGTTLDLRPGDSVNSKRGDSFTQLDLRLSRDFLFKDDMGIEVMVEVFNLTDEENGAVPDSFGVNSTYAGDPGQGEQRLIQLGARFHF